MSKNACDRPMKEMAVEPACGLLKFEKGGFGFIHLTFQEFLTANALVSGEAVSWWEADAFCRWLTKTRNDGRTYRLPSAQEWEAGAAGKEKREYPWEKKAPTKTNAMVPKTVPETADKSVFFPAKSSSCLVFQQFRKKSPGMALWAFGGFFG